MTNIIDQAAPWLRQGFRMMAREATYTPKDGTAAPVLAFIRGLTSEDLFAAAQQRDLVAVVDAEEFAATFNATPRKYDRIQALGPFSYAVEEWRGSPHDDEPVFFKILLRGGAQ